MAETPSDILTLDIDYRLAMSESKYQKNLA